MATTKEVFIKRKKLPTKAINKGLNQKIIRSPIWRVALNESETLTMKIREVK